eukprot:6192775-Pleurochrysis_carterae.AAC.2
MAGAEAEGHANADADCEAKAGGLWTRRTSMAWRTTARKLRRYQGEHPDCANECATSVQTCRLSAKKVSD